MSKTLATLCPCHLTVSWHFSETLISLFFPLVSFLLHLCYPVTVLSCLYCRHSGPLKRYTPHLHLAILHIPPLLSSSSSSLSFQISHFSYTFLSSFTLYSPISLLSSLLFSLLHLFLHLFLHLSLLTLPHSQRRLSLINLLTHENNYPISPSQKNLY